MSSRNRCSRCSRNRHSFRLCTLQEAQGRKQVLRLEAKGQNRYESLENLTKLCEFHKKAVPQLVVLEKQDLATTEWHCGTFKINGATGFFKKIFTPKTTVYNTVFWVELDNLVMCYVYI